MNLRYVDELEDWADSMSETCFFVAVVSEIEQKAETFISSGSIGFACTADCKNCVAHIPNILKAARVFTPTKDE